jgi:alpha-galactosidase
MVDHRTAAPDEIGWSDDALEVRLEVDEDGVPRLSHLVPRPGGDAAARVANEVPVPGDRRRVGLPLLDVVLTGSGRTWSGRRYCESVVGQRMRYAGHDEHEDATWHRLVVAVEDAETGLAAAVSHQFLRGGGVVRSQVSLTNGGPVPLTVESVTSFLGGGLAGPGGELEDVELLWAENDWIAEGRWQARRFRDALPEVNRAAHGSRSRGRFGLTSEGTWSSGTYLPMGAVTNRVSGHTWLWQIEHNGPWHWQVGEHVGIGTGSTYLALLGPTDVEHHWRLTLQPGESFETVPVAVALSCDGFEGAVGRLTRYRRVIRRPHQDHSQLPVIFNDYMNTLMGDPTTERLLPLISAAARVGAEYFCIDAGWHAELDEGWWDAVGAWLPSRTRFRKGIAEVLDRIRAEGMVPGLWIEPEVVGLRSPVADLLPVDAFFTRGGERVVEHGRYQLDFSHPRAREHLNKVVDRLVGDLGVGYLKMDYNINIAPGTAPAGVAAGVGLLAHNRAFLAWVDGLLDRYPGLTIENCSSGGMRTDYAQLSHLQLQSTSDQQDLLHYPPIAAAAPIAITPEQAAVWAYPQPEWDKDRIAFTLCSAMLGRVHLSGHLDHMTPDQVDLVAHGVRVYKQIRADLVGAVPFWPLGVPGWADPWVALGMRSEAATYVTVWRRHSGSDRSAASGARAGPAEISLRVGGNASGSTPSLLYPEHGAGLEWDAASRELRVRLDRTPSACLVRLGAP